jgi:hypothetical protein
LVTLEVRRRTMNGPSARDEPETTAKRLDHTAQSIRNRTTKLLSRQGDGTGNGRAKVPADILATVADSVEAVAEGALVSGMVVRDYGRDAARAMHRGERVLRQSGYLGGAFRIAGMARRNLRGLAVTGAGVAAAVVLYRRISRDS